MKKGLLTLAVALALVVWVLPAQAVTIPVHYDFNYMGSPTASGYTGVAYNKAYNATDGYGWISTTNLDGRDRGATGTTALTRDFAGALKTAGTKTFAIDLPNSTYTVTLTFYDKTNSKDGIYVDAEGTNKISNLSVGTATPVVQTFSVAVSDGQLTLDFYGIGGSSSWWIVNAIDVVPIPPSVLLLGSGLLGLGLLGLRRKRG